MNEFVGLQDLDAAELAQVEGGWSFKGALDSVMKFVQGGPGPYSAADSLATAGKAILLMPVIVPLAALAAHSH